MAKATWTAVTAMTMFMLRLNILLRHYIKY